MYMYLGMAMYNGVPYIMVLNVSLHIGGGGSSFRKLDKGEGHILEGRIGERVTFYGSTVPRIPPAHPPVITEGSLTACCNTHYYMPDISNFTRSIGKVTK